MQAAPRNEVILRGSIQQAEKSRRALLEAANVLPEGTAKDECYALYVHLGYGISDAKRVNRMPEE